MSIHKKNRWKVRTDRSEKTPADKADKYPVRNQNYHLLPHTSYHAQNSFTVEYCKYCRNKVYMVKKIIQYIKQEYQHTRIFPCIQQYLPTLLSSPLNNHASTKQESTTEKIPNSSRLPNSIATQHT